MRFYFIAIVVSILFLGSIQAQDLQYTQFQKVPVGLSPAMTGVMQKKFRLTGAMRRQWFSVPETKGWEQSTISFEGRQCFGDNFFAYGLMVQGDKMGGLSTANALANFSYHHYLGNDLFLSAGAAGGLLHYRFESEQTFDNQFGLQGYDKYLPSREDFDTDNRSAFDLSAGMLLFHTSREWTMGFALHHINQPTYSFIGKDENRLGVGLTVHGSLALRLSNITEKNKIIVRGMYRRQSAIRNSRQWHSIFGGTWRHRPNRNSETGFRVGLSARLSGQSENGPLLVDALLPAVYLDYEFWSIGMSYDINTSSARKETHLRGAWELTFTRQFGKGNDCDPGCPNF